MGRKQKFGLRLLAYLDGERVDAFGGVVTTLSLKFDYTEPKPSRLKPANLPQFNMLYFSPMIAPA
jgi:hypothetical protein